MTGISQIVVLGMHESGAPAVSRLLVSMGANPGERSSSVDAKLERPRNAWVNAAVSDLNEAVLSQFGSSWLDVGPLLIDRLPETDLRDFQAEARAILASLESPGPCVMHDPCMALVFELWKPLLSSAACVLVHRAPGIVAHSLSLRHALPLQHCVAVWERHNRASLAASSSLPRSLVAYEQLLRHPRRTAVELHRELEALGVEGLQVPQADAFHALADAGLPDVGLSPEQYRLASALEDGTALDEPAYRSAAVYGNADDGNRQWPAGQNSPTAAASTGSATPVEIKLLRQREKVRALQAEIAELRQVSPRRPAKKSDTRSNGVFVIGCPRSGTSVFAWALAQHPNFWTSAESDYLLNLFGQGRLYSVYNDALQREDRGWLNKHQVGFSEFAECLGLGAEALFDSRSGGARWVDATPGYTLMTEELLQMFPAARFLHIVRDGRAVVNSMISSGFDTNWATNFATACRTWVHYATLGHKAVEQHPERVLEVRHDELASNPESELARVFAFLGEEPSNRSVRLIAKGRINSSYGNVRPGDIKLAKDPALAPKRPWETWTANQTKTFRNIAGSTMSALGHSG